MAIKFETNKNPIINQLFLSLKKQKKRYVKMEIATHQIDHLVYLRRHIKKQNVYPEKVFVKQ